MNTDQLKQAMERYRKEPNDLNDKLCRRALVSHSEEIGYFETRDYWDFYVNLTTKRLIAESKELGRLV